MALLRQSHSKRESLSIPFYSQKDIYSVFLINRVESRVGRDYSQKDIYLNRVEGVIERGTYVYVVVALDKKSNSA